MLRCLAQRIYGILDLRSLAAGGFDGCDDSVIRFWMPTLLWMLFGEMTRLLIGFAPAIPADFVEGIHSPFDDMEGIDTALTVRSEFIDTVSDSSGSVTCDDLDTAELLRCEDLVELLQNALAVAICDPDDLIGVMVDDDSDVLMPLAVACLVNANIDKTVESARALRFQVMQASRDTVAYGLPVDAHVAGYSAPGEIVGQPCYSQVEVSGEAAAGICPWHVGGHNTVFRALHTMSAVLDLHQDATEVQCSPDLRILSRSIIAWTFTMTVWAVIVPCIGACSYPKMLDTMSIVIEAVVFNNHAIDIQRLPQ